MSHQTFEQFRDERLNALGLTLADLTVEQKLQLNTQYEAHDKVREINSGLMVSSACGISSDHKLAGNDGSAPARMEMK
jgi:hypothetical protein